MRVAAHALPRAAGHEGNRPPGAHLRHVGAVTDEGLLVGYVSALGGPGAWTPDRFRVVVDVDEVWRGRVWSARPVTVVKDEGGFVALWCPKGTRWKTATTPPTRPRAATRAERFVANLTRCDWVLGDFTWPGHTLSLVLADEWHEVRVAWRDHAETGLPWEPWGWYVNLQEPVRRTAVGFQTMDLMLDILVGDGGCWQWKDEDELEALVAHGLLAGAIAQRLRDEGRLVGGRVERNEPPFCGPWHAWRPGPSWLLPVLSSGWDRP